MKAGGGGKKGSAFERKICVALSLWMSGEKSKDWFWRTAMSGGRATVIRKKTEEILLNQVGDVGAISRGGLPLTNSAVIECKHVKSLGLHQLVCATGGPIEKFWQRVWQEAQRAARCPMLIAQQNRLPTLLMIPEELGMHLEVELAPLVESMHRGWGLYNFDEFTRLVDPKIFCREAKKWARDQWTDA